MLTGGKLGVLATQLESVILKRRSRYEIWQTKTKQLIRNALQEAQRQIDHLGCHVSTNEPLKNFEAVYLKVHDRCCGIQLDTPQSKRNYLWMAGGLIYSQNPDGTILTWYELPYVRDIEKKPAGHKVRDGIEPIDIGASTVKDDVANYLDFLIEYESGKRSNERRIGFCHPSPTEDGSDSTVQTEAIE